MVLVGWSAGLQSFIQNLEVLGTGWHSVAVKWASRKLNIATSTQTLHVWCIYQDPPDLGCLLIAPERCDSGCPWITPWGSWYIYIYIPRTHLTSVLIGKDYILGGWCSKIEVTQVIGIYIYICLSCKLYACNLKRSPFLECQSVLGHHMAMVFCFG